MDQRNNSREAQLDEPVRFFEIIFRSVRQEVLTGHGQPTGSHIGEKPILRWVVTQKSCIPEGPYVAH